MERFKILDTIRGITLISMILYHGMWDIVNLCGKNIPWYGGTIGYVWQQSICWTFILLSGFCFSLGRRSLKRGAVVLAAGTVITIVTLVVMPEQRVVFGVLTFLGVAMLLTEVLYKGLKKINPAVGLFLFAVLFFIFRNINRGTLGFEGIAFCEIPEAFYSNYFTTFLGFPYKGFFSTDYFSLLPWYLLYLTGFFLYGFVEKKYLSSLVGKKREDIVSFIGKHSLIIYMLHQPLLYGIFALIL
ncbi:MAG: DUF1624 domain-containing protein [Lachnospiraceae bacterium]|nr:DUF1624 domain-containing protein [Lachnospiraceae bacterium]